MAATKQHSTPELPFMLRSHNYAVPSLTFWEKKFFPYWLQYCDARQLRNFGQSFCELFAMAATVEAVWLSGPLSEGTKKDQTTAIFPVSIYINRGPFLGMSEPEHFTNLIAFHHEGSEEVELVFWEPQLKVFRYAPIDDALNFVTLHDVLSL
jgi:hypothetical protein